MEKAVERRRAEQVRRLLAAELRPLGFERTKPTFYTTTGEGLVVGFMHIHKFTFCPGFRAHAGVRVLNDPFEGLALNGPTSSPDNLFGDFLDNDESVAKQARLIARWFEKDGLPWVRRALLPGALDDRRAPFEERERQALKEHAQGRPVQERLELSRRELGLK